jgi:hypothetical protein
MALELKRLADRILYAQQLALEQNDLEVAEMLNAALEKALTRLSGGKDFTERRDFSAEYAAAMIKLSDLRSRA